MRSEVLMRSWEIEWAIPGKDEQSVTIPFARTLSAMPPTTQCAFALEGGGGRALRSSLVCMAPDEEDLEAVRALFAALAPSIGLSETPTTSPRSVRGTVLSATIETIEPRGEPLTADSHFARVAATSAHPWQLVIASGPRDPDTGHTHVALTLIGSGPELTTGGTLLELDSAARGYSLEIRLEPARGHTPEYLLDTIRFGGTVPLPVLGRMLSIPLRVPKAVLRLPAPPAGSARILEEAKVAVPPHIQLLGMSGSGKTQLLGHLVKQSIEEGAVPLVVDSTGDLPHLAVDIMSAAGTTAPDLLDFGSASPPSWNLSVPDRGIDAAEHAQLLVGTMAHLWDNDEWTGPVWHQLFGWAMELLCLDRSGPWPITYVPELFHRKSDFRSELLERAPIHLQRMWESEVQPFLNQRDPGSSVTWVVSKLQPFVSDPSVRSIIGHMKSDVDLAGVLQGRPLIAAFPQTTLTPSGSRLLGGLLLGRLWRLVKKSGARREVHVFLDEWQNLAVPEIGEMLAEGRKFGLKLFLSNQHAQQIPPRLWDAAMANTGVIIAFRTGPKEAALIEPRYPTIPAGPLARLPKHWVAVSTGADDFVARAPDPLAVATQSGVASQARVAAQWIPGEPLAHEPAGGADSAIASDAVNALELS